MALEQDLLVSETQHARAPGPAPRGFLGQYVGDLSQTRKAAPVGG